MKPAAERHAWIVEYLNARQRLLSSARYRVDILNSDFVWSYIEAFEPKSVRVAFIGAPRCPLLSYDLRKMWEAGVLDRHTTGIEGLSGQGFPRWVWSYHLR